MIIKTISVEILESDTKIVFKGAKGLNTIIQFFTLLAKFNDKFCQLTNLK